MNKIKIFNYNGSYTSSAKSSFNKELHKWIEEEKPNIINTSIGGGENGWILTVVYSKEKEIKDNKEIDLLLS